MKRRLILIISMALLIVGASAAASVTYAASPKLPKAKITHINSYNWYEYEWDEDMADYEPDYLYYDSGEYNDDSGYYIKCVDFECRKEKGNVKYQFAFREGNGAWDKFTYGKDRSVSYYDIPRNITVSVKVRTYKEIGGKRYYGKWSPVVKESTHDKEVHANRFYAKSRYVKGYIRGAFKGEKIKVKIGSKTYTAKVKRTAGKYKFKIRIGKHTPGQTVKIQLCSKTGDVMYTYTGDLYYAKDIGKGYTKKQVKWTYYWGSPDDTASSSDGWSYWYYDDGSYIGFKNGKVKYWYDAAG